MTLFFLILAFINTLIGIVLVVGFILYGSHPTILLLGAVSSGFLAWMWYRDADVGRK